MDIAGLSTNLSTINVVNDVQVAVLRQSLDTLETSGDSLTKMIEASVNPELGQNIDISISVSYTHLTLPTNREV